MAYRQCSDEAPRTRVLKLWAPHTTDDLLLNIVMVRNRVATVVRDDNNSERLL